METSGINNDFLKIFNSDKYDFIRSNADLKNILYLALSGSRAYGTNNAGSDYDLRGFLLEDKKYIYGLHDFEQFENTETDTVIYGLRKFVNLCINANPNTIELLGIPKNELVIMSDVGELIHDNSELFLSKRIISSFGNYALSQLRRLENALNIESYDERKKEEHLLNSLTRQTEHFERVHSDFNRGDFNVYLNEENILCIDMNFKNFPLRDFLSIKSEISNTFKIYDKLTKRNTKKSPDKLYKHAMHLVRLLLTGKDILDGFGIITKRKNEHDLLMDIRNGNLSFKEIFEIIDDLENEYKKSAEKTKLPKAPAIGEIEKMLIEIYTN